MGSVADGRTGVGKPPYREPPSGPKSPIAKFRRTSLATGQTKRVTSLNSLIPYSSVLPFACRLLEEFFSRKGAKRMAFRPIDSILGAFFDLFEFFGRKMGTLAPSLNSTR
jgi:hypothetical protein